MYHTGVTAKESEDTGAFQVCKTRTMSDVLGQPVLERLRSSVHTFTYFTWPMKPLYVFHFNFNFHYIEAFSSMKTFLMVIKLFLYRCKKKRKDYFNDGLGA